MIAFLRDLVTKDLGLKLLSLALSTLIYSTVSIFAIRDPQSLTLPAMPPEVWTVTNVPVLVMSSAADVRQFKISPEKVTVTLQGDPRSVSRLEDSGIRALVDLTGIETARDMRKRIEVSVPAGITPLHVEPTHVWVLPPKR